MRNTLRFAPLTLLVALCTMFVAAATQAATLRADYQFQNSLASSTVPAPALTNLTGTNHLTGEPNSPNTFETEAVDGKLRTVLRFPRGNGVSLSGAPSVVGSTTSYSIVMLFSLAELEGYRRILGFADEDNGLYNRNGKLEYFPLATGEATPIARGRYVQVVLTRDSGGNLTGYANGVRQFAYEFDSNDASVDTRIRSVLSFFRDNTTDAEQEESSDGAVERIRLYNGVLTAAEVSALDRLPAPSITSFSPASGLAGTRVAINGVNLTGATAVRFNGVLATNVTINVLGTQILATVPVGATTGRITVTTSVGTATSANIFIASPPTISSFTPASGPFGTTVTINGTNFTSASVVKFNGVTATTRVVDSPTSIRATVPSGATTGRITVTTALGTATSAVIFRVLPSIRSFTPTSGPTGTVVVITGTSLTTAVAVRFGGVSAAFTRLSDTQVRATVPADAISGPITVTTPAGTATSATSFLVIPRITSFTPTNGPVGTSVDITGSGFAFTGAVKFGSVNATFTRVSSTHLRVTVPAGAVTGKISVITGGGTATSSANFTVTTASIRLTFASALDVQRGRCDESYQRRPLN